MVGCHKKNCVGGVYQPWVTVKGEQVTQHPEVMDEEELYQFLLM